MFVTREKLQPPSTDKRWKLVSAAMRKAGHEEHALIETLHKVQDAFGYLDDISMTFVAQSLGVPLSKVYGVATFYHLFTLKPKGAHTCVVCTGTACYIRGAKDLVDRLREHYKLRLGETTVDGQLSALGARCLGACGLAPAVVVDGQVLGNVSADGLQQSIEDVI